MAKYNYFKMIYKLEVLTLLKKGDTVENLAKAYRVDPKEVAEIKYMIDNDCVDLSVSL